MNQNSKLALSIVGILAITVITVVYIVKDTSDPIPQTQPEVNTEVSVNDEVKEDVFRDAYLKECSKDTSYSFCVCTIDYMEDKVGKKGLIKEAMYYERLGRSTPLMDEAVLECIHLF